MNAVAAPGAAAPGAPEAAARAPHPRLASFYFAYYSVVGAFMPYWSLWLAFRDLSASEIGLIFGAMATTRLFMPIVWGWYADRSARRMRLIRTGCVVSLLIFLAIPLSSGFWALLLLSVAYNLFWNAILPQFETVTLAHLREAGHAYSRVRAWGSVGFVVTVLAFGPLLDFTGVGPLPWLIAVPFALMALVAFTVPEPPAPAAGLDGAVSMGAVLRRPEVRALLAACFLSQLSFAPYYGFFSLFLELHGYNRSYTGVLWALGVIAEIGVFLGMGQLLLRYSVRRLMLFALATTAARWVLLVAFADSLPMLVCGQVLHLSSFGLFHACAIHYFHRLFPGRLQGRGQALYNSVAFGAGGGLGSLLTGFVWDHGSPDATFWIAALAATGSFWIALRRLH